MLWNEYSPYGSENWVSDVCVYVRKIHAMNFQHSSSMKILVAQSALHKSCFFFFDATDMKFYDSFMSNANASLIRRVIVWSPPYIKTCLLITLRRLPNAFLMYSMLIAGRLFLAAILHIFYCPGFLNSFNVRQFFFLLLEHRQNRNLTQWVSNGDSEKWKQK